ncbi:MAG TPA: tyrosine--tRNA ligase [Candidatus Nanoarchaeia archaeon]|nr:tyrosine--tRNA ligase [Candidatus Nanoarchaeia archaeon]
MDVEKRFDLITKNTAEILTEDDLRELLETGTPLDQYIGFEISGRIHLGTGLVCMGKVNDFMKARVKCKILLADWHSWINDKFGGDLEVIKKVAVGYFKEGLKASLECVGGDPEKVKFVLGSKLYSKNDEYWKTLIDISKHTTLARVMRSVTIMGRKEGESVDFAKLIYSPMQVADIFIQGVNVAHAGLDQRKAHVIAREVASKLKSPLKNKKGKIISPVAVHHPLILGLGKPPVWPVPKENLQELWSSMKMSKSIPTSAVFIHDTEEEIRSKVNSAFCMMKEVEFNPIMDWCKRIIFTDEKVVFKIERDKKFGGDLSYNKYAALERDFLEGKVHPQDLKRATAEFLVKKLAPIRRRFDVPRIKKMKEELEKLTVTR